jgi:hypothetical protein
VIGPKDPTLERACDLAGSSVPEKAVPFDRFVAASLAALRRTPSPTQAPPGADPTSALLAELSPLRDPTGYSRLDGLPRCAAMHGPNGQERARALVEALYAAAWNLDPNPADRAYGARLIASTTAGNDASATVVGLVEGADGEDMGVAFLAERSVHSLACADEDELLALWASISAQVEGPLPDGTVSVRDLDAIESLLAAVWQAEDLLERLFDPKGITEKARRALADAGPVVEEAREELRTRFSTPIP